MDEHLKR